MKKEEAIAHYLALQAELTVIRARHHGKESIEEDMHLGEMDKAWATLDRLEVETKRITRR